MKSKSKKIFAVFLVLTLIFSMSSVSFADTTDAADGYSLADFGSKVGSITITGAAVDDYTREVEAYTRGSGSNVETFHKYTYNIVLAQGTSPTATVTANFTKSADAGENCYIAPFGTLMQPPQGPIILMNNARLNYAATLSEGVGTTTAYVTYNLTNTDGFAGYGKYDTYVFNYSIADSNKTVTTSSGITMRFGDPAYAETAPESEMRFTGSGNTYTAVYRGTRDGYYPNTLALYLTGNSSITATTTNGNTNNVCFVTYDDDNVETEVSSISSSGNSNKLSATVRVKAAGSIKINNTVTLHFEAPREPAVPGGVAPSRVVSYLPIGQFATGSGWGSATGKFTGGYAPTGVSLGALGGYIEFEFANGIANNSNNPYGVDFVVYGNAFNGNPEAGAVQVSEDGKTWYELAGSMYYDGNFNYVETKVANKFSAAYTGTLNKATVEYEKGASFLTVGLKETNGNTYLVPSGTTFGPLGWFPATDKYPQGDAHDNTGANVTVSYTANNLAFSGITAIQDYNTTATYAFGYADVTPNGSPATYGDAVNPYITEKTGGDGFDLEWAVDPSTKLPVDVTGKAFKYVRVYSAVLDNATFGETSTEVCGIFTTANGQKNEDGSAVPVGRTAAPTVKYGTSKLKEVTTSHGQVIEQTVSTNSYKLQVSASDTANIYINNIKAVSGTNYTFDIPSEGTSMVRIIVQDGDSAPYITYFKVTKK